MPIYLWLEGERWDTIVETKWLGSNDDVKQIPDKVIEVETKS
jgi:hypothetical protein